MQAAQELIRGARPPEGARSRPDPATQDDFITAGEIERRVNLALDRAIERRDTAMLENLASFVELTQSVDEAAPGSLFGDQGAQIGVQLPIHLLAGQTPQIGYGRGSAVCVPRFCAFPVQLREGPIGFCQDALLRHCADKSPGLFSGKHRRTDAEPT